MECRGFLRQRPTLYDTMMEDTCHIPVKTHIMCNSRDELLQKLWALEDTDVSMWVHQL